MHVGHFWRSQDSVVDKFNYLTVKWVCETPLGLVGESAGQHMSRLFPSVRGIKFAVNSLAFIVFVVCKNENPTNPI